MFPLVAALAGPAISGIASLIGGSRANKANQAMSREQMNFQEQMSSTAYQRAVDDLKKAGLNPMLAYQQGGASSPSGAQLPMSDVVTPAVSSAMQAARNYADIKNLQEMNKKIQSDVVLNQALEKSAKADAILKTNSAKVADVNSKLLTSELPAAVNKADIESSSQGKVLRWVDRVVDSIGGFFGLIKPGSSFKR